jgi:hypothetical protein
MFGSQGAHMCRYAWGDLVFLVSNGYAVQDADRDADLPGRGFKILRRFAETTRVNSMTKLRTATWFRVALVAGLCALAVGLMAPAAGAIAGFGDVDEDDYFAHAVQWMVDNSYIEETSPGCFSPDAPATRGEMAMLIHKVNGEPNPGGGEPFSDVTPADDFYEAVAWLYQTGITVGTSATTFSPESDLTRAETAAFLYRLAGEPGGAGEPFLDVSPSDWFSDPVGWMVAEEITVGTSATEFSPYRTLTRAHVVTFMYRSAGEPYVSLDLSGTCGPVDAYPTLADAEAASFVLLSELRASLGRVELTRDSTMDAAARNWSHTMDTTGKFEHSTLGWAENIAGGGPGARRPPQRNCSTSCGSTAAGTTPT